MDKEELKGDGGEKKRLFELDKHYKKESRVRYISKVKEYYKIEREHKETMGYYILRYERLARECKKAREEPLMNEVKGFYPLGEAGQSEIELQVVFLWRDATQRMDSDRTT